MVALWNRADHFIFFALWFLLFSSSFFSPHLISVVASQIGCLPYFHTWCGLSAKLGCRSERCCTWLAESTGRKKSPRIPIWAPSHKFVKLSGYIFGTKACIDNRKKVLNSNTSSTCPDNMVNVGPLAAEIDLPVWGTHANFNGFRVLAAFLQRRRSPEANQTLYDVCPSPALVHYIIHFRVLAPLRNFARCRIHFLSAKFCALVFS